MAPHDDDDEVVSCIMMHGYTHTVCDVCLCNEIPLSIYNICEPKYYIIYSIY